MVPTPAGSWGYFITIYKSGSSKDEVCLSQDKLCITEWDDQESVTPYGASQGESIQEPATSRHP